MNIRGVDRVVLGVEEMDAAQRFLRDFGLSEIERGEHGATFEALDGTNLVLRGAWSPETRCRIRYRPWCAARHRVPWRPGGPC